MNNPGHLALEKLGAEAAQLTSKQAVPLSDSLQCIDCSHLAVLSFSGADAAKFLQAQTCNDHSAVSDSKAQINGYCSPKGRLLGLPLVAMLENDSATWYWLLPKDVVDAVVKRLTMFVMRDDVSITVQQDWMVVGLALPSSLHSQALEPWVGGKELPMMSTWSANDIGHLKARSADSATRVLLFGPHTSVTDSVQRCLQAHASEATNAVQWAGPSTWHLGDIQAGMPCVVAASQDQFMPQMLNLSHIDGLSFSKGCYPGQEVVARLHYLGKLKRSMVHLSCTANTELAPGQDIACGEDAKAGTVVSCVQSAAGTHCLAVVKVAADETAFLLDGNPCTVQPLPYSTVVEEA